MVDVPKFKLAVPTQPLPSDIVAEYTPDVFVEMLLVVAPLDQEYCQLPGTLATAVIVLELPGQMLAGTLLSVTIGCETTTVDVLVEEQPLVDVITQVYILVAVGETLIDEVVAPVDQAYVLVDAVGPALIIVKFTGDEPGHMVWVPGLIAAFGDGNTRMV